MQSNTPPPPSPAPPTRSSDYLSLAALSNRDLRTVRAVYCGRGRRLSRESIADAARALGFAPPPPPTDE